MKKKKLLLKFPKSFLWGTSTAGHQVEGNNINSDWWAWEKLHKDFEDSGVACNHYYLYRNDFRLCKDFLHNNSHRFSIEWSRIEPKEGKFDTKEIKHYQKVLKELKKLGLKSVVTLHHFVSPLWFSKLGGFEKKENTYYFLRYVEKCAELFGDMVDYWCIFNEPNVFVGQTYLVGVWPPKRKNWITAFGVYLNMARAHVKAYKVMHSVIPNANVCSVMAVNDVKAFSILSKPLSAVARFISIDFFYLITHKYHDFLGINCYGVFIVKWLDLFIKRISFSEIKKIEMGEVSDLGWPIYPPSIYNVVKRIYKKYKLPIIITENGVADSDDSKRPRYIVDYLTWLHQAIDEGVDVRGYFHWTLMDNYEWHMGRKARFGLFETDYKSLRRIPRDSAFLYGKIAKDNALSIT